VKHDATMQKLTATDPETHSPDLVAENLAALQALFPELITEGPDGVAVNIDVLKALVGDKTVSDADEKYGLNWHGKRRARQLALTPSTGTLRPCQEDSVDWDTTQNLMIEGDNLEVLKLLQKSYAGKVKLIYIDPPYNTGKDFVYPDNFQDNIKNYLELTGQTGEGGKKLSSNTEASGRFHTDWLNMMYPRLKLARNLLREDGVLFVSIDEREVASLRTFLDEIFGRENNICEFVWQAKKGGGSDNRGIVSEHEYVVSYCRNIDGGPLGQLTIDAEPLDQTDLKGPYRQGRELNKWGANSLRKDRPTMFFPIPGPGGVEVNPIRNDGKEGCWRWGKSKILEAVANGDVDFVARGNGTYIAYEKIRSSDPRRKPFRTLLTDIGQTADGTKAIKELFDGERVFDFAKPPALISALLAIGMPSTDDDEVEQTPIVMDFFAGSGTTGNSAMLRAVGGTESSCRFILVQLPEKLDPNNSQQKIAADFCDKLSKHRNIAELTKERLRRSAKKIQNDNMILMGDLGFRVFKLDSTNIHEWNPDRDKIAETLEDSIEHLKTDRTEQDILFELLLKLGLDLCVTIETRKVDGCAKLVHDIHSIGGGSLLVCLSKSIPQDDVEPVSLALVAWHQELKPAGDTTVVFRDSAFADDVAKTNIAAILQQHGLETVRSL
jgi:adenine-specific DNA-methyltransferase